MDQLDILARLEQLVDAYEQALIQHYTALERSILAEIEKHMEQYGETLQESLKYNRLEQLKKRLDTVAATHYEQILQDVATMEEESFHSTYLLYAYLLYATMSEEEGEFKEIVATAAITSAAVALVLLLLRAKNKIQKTLKRDLTVIAEIFQKHKNDFVYNIYMDVRTGLSVEEGYIETKKRVKKRAESAKGYGLSRLHDAFNYAVNFTQEQVFEVVKHFNHEKVNDDKPNLFDKIWASMKDLQVRLSHRILDGQKADKDGWFYYQGKKAKRPKGFGVPDLDYGCRCKLFISYKGSLPKTSKVYDYTNEEYKAKINREIAALVADGKTYLQAVREAESKIKPPKRTIKGYVTWETWNEKYGPDK